MRASVKEICKKKKAPGGWSLDGLPTFATNLLCVLGQVTLVPGTSAPSSVLPGQDLMSSKIHSGWASASLCGTNYGCWFKCLQGKDFQIWAECLEAARMELGKWCQDSWTSDVITPRGCPRYHRSPSMPGCDPPQIHFFPSEPLSWVVSQRSLNWP